MITKTDIDRKFRYGDTIAIILNTNGFVKCDIIQTYKEKIMVGYPNGAVGWIPYEEISYIVHWSDDKQEHIKKVITTLNESVRGTKVSLLTGEVI